MKACQLLQLFAQQHVPGALVRVHQIQTRRLVARVTEHRPNQLGWQKRSKGSTGNTSGENTIKCAAEEVVVVGGGIKNRRAAIMTFIGRLGKRLG